MVTNNLDTKEYRKRNVNISRSLNQIWISNNKMSNFGNVLNARFELFIWLRSVSLTNKKKRQGSCLLEEILLHQKYPISFV